jgi:hypothetical protein
MSPFFIWRDHGTKVLGVLSTVIGALQAADWAVAEFLSRKEHAALSIAMSVVGALTVRRGFDNSERNGQ